MRNSNINIVKDDIEFTDIQEQINLEREKERQVNRLLNGGVGAPAQEQVAQIGEVTKVKVSYEEYQKLAFLILTHLKNLERDGIDNVQQHDIVESVIKSVTDNSNSVSLEKSVELKKLV
jgi:hypothetical protein